MQSNSDVSIKIEANLADVGLQQEFVKALPCPQCAQRGKLRLVSFEVGYKRLFKHGWEAKIACDGCKSQGVLNQTGFHFELTSAVQQVKTEEKKK